MSWGTICDDGWDIEDAHVICKQKGFRGASKALPGGSFGKGKGDIWLSGVNCYGKEERIRFCRSSEHNCTHEQDAGVICETGT